jgi:hypothetical protein
MALLHYQNLGVRRPEILLSKAFHGLGTFFRFLDQTKKHMESDAAVQRLAFKPGVAPEGDPRASRGVWVQVEEPPDSPNEPESTFRAFMDENVREVFEASTFDASEKHGLRRSTQRKFASERKIVVLDRDPETLQLLLERLPRDAEFLLLRPNTLTLRRQIDALQFLQNKPSPTHLPLLRLMESTEHARWPDFTSATVDDWMVLKDDSRPGTTEQRSFVCLALATPEFVFLEGPPGSGKTTAICELILQLARQGKRVLLCASTNVAVDNVLERLIDDRNPDRDLVIPIRIGEQRNVSEKARPWQMENFVKSERDRLLHKLASLKTLSGSQGALLEALRHETTVIERMVLDAANLVCGTTMGILQHPDIKGGGDAATFDMLIVDEASKTTFQEFLVPALYAKRWVIVGDPKQLSPYVDDEAIAVNIESCLPSTHLRNACIDVYTAGTADSRRRRVAAIVTDTPEARQAYLAQASAHEVPIAEAGGNCVSLASVVIGDLDSMRRCEGDLPLDVATVRAPLGELDHLRRRGAAWLNLAKRDREEQPEWSEEIAWRLARLYDQRFAKQGSIMVEGRRWRSTSERLRQQVDDLLPVSATGIDTDKVWSEIDRVRRVALPSILESLRYGFERDASAYKGSALSDGLPESALAQRHVLLSTQHRMHPDIASFSHTHIYDGQALFTPERMTTERAWAYPRHARRAVWFDVRGGFNGRVNANPNEAKVVMDELRAFDEWASKNQRNDGRPWEAAVLTFYRGQERELRNHLRNWTKQQNTMNQFIRGPRQRPHLSIELCTVDRFQGHEADLVIITFASPRPTSFLESPNRLNVALTRARYQRVIVGDRTAMQAARGSALGVLAANEPWDRAVTGGVQ